MKGASDSVFVVYADQGAGSIDLKVSYFKGISSLVEGGSLLAVKGLDGDIKYNVGFENSLPPIAIKIFIVLPNKIVTSNTR